MRFANTDVWVRDIAQTIDDAITRAQPTDGKVTLVGYSLGALRVGRALYAASYPEIVEQGRSSCVLVTVLRRADGRDAAAAAASSPFR